MERRLAAILVADVVGYSRLMGADEEGTLARLKVHRDEVIHPRILRTRSATWMPCARSVSRSDDLGTLTCTGTNLFLHPRLSAARLARCLRSAIPGSRGSRTAFQDDSGGQSALMGEEVLATYMDWIARSIRDVHCLRCRLSVQAAQLTRGGFF